MYAQRRKFQKNSLRIPELRNKFIFHFLKHSSELTSSAFVRKIFFLSIVSRSLPFAFLRAATFRSGLRWRQRTA